MGIFSKKPSGSQQAYIASAISEVQIQYKNVATTSNIEIFLESYRKTKDSMKYLLDAERKFPSYFRHPKPSENMKKIEKKREKEGLPPQKITNQANQNTRNIETKIDKGMSGSDAGERARKIDESYQNARKAKPGSITAKANMVRDFDERNKKK